MTQRPNIQAETFPDENIVQLKFNPIPDEYHIYEIAEWMERVPGITSVAPSLGSIALRTAHPPFPLDVCRAEVQKVADMYFEDPEEKARAINSDIFNYAWSDELRREFSKTKLAGSLLMERHSAREFDPADLFIVTNSQIPSEHEPHLAATIMEQDKRVYIALRVDNGYGIHIRIQDIFIGFEPKEVIATDVIDLLTKNDSLFRKNWLTD